MRLAESNGTPLAAICPADRHPLRASQAAKLLLAASDSHNSKDNWSDLVAFKFFPTDVMLRKMIGGHLAAHFMLHWRSTSA